MTVSSLKWSDRSTGGTVPMSPIAAAQQTLAGLAGQLRAILGSVPSTEAAADELFDRAAAYEATQPGYAADLRAAAIQARGRHFGGW
jgi:hypothetical protein